MALQADRSRRRKKTAERFELFLETRKIFDACFLQSQTHLDCMCQKLGTTELCFTHMCRWGLNPNSVVKNCTKLLILVKCSAARLVCDDVRAFIHASVKARWEHLKTWAVTNVILCTVTSVSCDVEGEKQVTNGVNKRTCQMELNMYLWSTSIISRRQLLKSYAFLLWCYQLLVTNSTISCQFVSPCLGSIFHSQQFCQILTSVFVHFNQLNKFSFPEKPHTHLIFQSYFNRVPTLRLVLLMLEIPTTHSQGLNLNSWSCVCWGFDCRCGASDWLSAKNVSTLNFTCQRCKKKAKKWNFWTGAQTQLRQNEATLH